MAATDRMLAMAQQRDAMTQKLVDALDRLNNNLGTSGGGLSGSAMGGGVSGGGGSGSARASAGSPFGYIDSPGVRAQNQAAAKFRSENAYQAPQQTYSNKFVGNGEQLGSAVLGAIAAPVTTFGYGAISALTRGKENIISAGGATYNPTDSDKMAKSRGESAMRLAALDRDDTADQYLAFAGDKEAFSRIIDRKSIRSQYAREDYKEFDTEGRADARTEQAFAGIARAGGFKGENAPNVRKSLDAYHERALMLENNQAMLKDEMHKLHVARSATAPGNAQALSPH